MSRIWYLLMNCVNRGLIVGACKIHRLPKWHAHSINLPVYRGYRPTACFSEGNCRRQFYSCLQVTAGVRSHEDENTTNFKSFVVSVKHFMIDKVSNNYTGTKIRFMKKLKYL
jgi:hypothetical protein